MASKSADRAAHAGFTYVIAAYGVKYAAFIAPLLESIEACAAEPAAPGARGLVLYQDLPEREVLALAHAYPGFEFRLHTHATGRDVMHAIPRKMHAWLEGARAFPDRAVAFLDCDTLLMRSIDDVASIDVSSSWDILFTWKDELFPINTGVMLARDGAVAAHVFGAMLTRIERLIADKGAFATAVGSSGAADQHALREIIGFCNYDRTITRPVTHAGVTREVAFRGEPCRVWNETNCRGLDDALRIVHYKTGWHPILLENAPFTRNRPETACAAMFRHWHQTEQASAARIARSLAFEGARRAFDCFQTIAGGYEERGILHSEMLAVCGVSDLLNVDVVIESGRCRGQSTLVLSRYFEGRDVKIVSIELMKDENAPFAEARLAHFANTQLLYGDVNDLLPGILAQHAGKRVALLLDGPKGQPALDIARAMFAQHPNLVCAFVHDMRLDTPQRPAAEREPMRSFFTDDEGYLRAFSALDGACMPGPGQPITMHTWRPFMKGEDRIPAYGPTLGVFFGRPAGEARFASAPAQGTAANTNPAAHAVQHTVAEKV